MKRILYGDMLKILSSFFVVLLHVCAANWLTIEIDNRGWNIINFFDSISRFCVPVFVMTSGMILLDPKKHMDIKTIYTKYIARMICVYIFWSCFYALATNYRNYEVFNYRAFINSFVFGHYHLWYLYMLIGLYVITPIVRKIVQDEKDSLYFIILSFIFTSIVPMIINLSGLEVLKKFVVKFEISFVIGYVGYYIAGYYLHKKDISKFLRNIIYVLGVLGSVSTYLLTDYISKQYGKPNEMFYSYFSPNVVIQAIAIFVFFKYKLGKIKLGEKLSNIINIISTASFGIYLIHDFYNAFFEEIGFTIFKFNEIYSIPILTISVYILSFITSYIISKIPLLKKLV